MKEKKPKKPKKPPKPRREGLPEIFNAGLGEEELSLALGRVFRGNEPWIVKAVIVCYPVLFEKYYVTADDFWYACLRSGVGFPRENRAMAHVITAFVRDKLIEKTEMWWKSDFVACHRRDKKVWRSLVCLRPPSPKMLRPL